MRRSLGSPESRVSRRFAVLLRYSVYTCFSIYAEHPVGRTRIPRHRFRKVDKSRNKRTKAAADMHTRGILHRNQSTARKPDVFGNDSFRLASEDINFRSFVTICNEAGDLVRQALGRRRAGLSLLPVKLKGGHERVNGVVPCSGRKGERASERAGDVFVAKQSAKKAERREIRRALNQTRCAGIHG